MILIIAIIIGAVFLDQLTKWLAVIYLQGIETFPLWKDVLHLTFHTNKGAAFGMLSQHRWVFMVFSSVAIVAMLVYLIAFPPKSKFLKISLAMVIGGGIGNMIDRLLLGYVIDFIDFTLIDFAIFNVADSFVTVGAFMIMGYLILDMIREVKKPKTETEQVEPVSSETENKHE